jgi:CheY-like chemotaxis protein
MVYGDALDRLRQGFPSGLQIAAQKNAAAMRSPCSQVTGKPLIAASQPIGPERSPEELHIAGDRRRRVLVADQDGFARRMLQRVVQDIGEVVMTTGARDSREALELARQYRPGMLLVDITLPPAGALELIRDVVAILPRVRIMTVSAAVDRDRAVLAALRAGAIGHIDKETAPDQIARLVTLAADGETIVPRRLMKRLLARWRIPPPAGGRGAAP